MIIGAPAEIKTEEKKVALTPALAHSLVSLGHKVVVQKGFASGAGFSDFDYTKYGVETVNSAQEVYSASDVIVKINQPSFDEYDLLKDNQVIFAFFKFSENDNLLDVVLDKKITTINLAKIKNNEGDYPFIKAGSEIVGKTLIRIVSDFAQKYMGGALIGGATGIAPMKITVLGAGTVGSNAAKTALALGADVSVLDIEPHVLEKYSNQTKIKTYFANRENVEKLLPETDVLICAVRRSKKDKYPIIKVDDVNLMKKGSFIIDAGLASGNIVVETMDRVQNAENPVFVNDGIYYFCAPDIASMAAKTVSACISGIIEKYLVSAISFPDIIDALRNNREMISGVMTYDGNITDEETADEVGELVYELSMLTGF